MSPMLSPPIQDGSIPIRHPHFDLRNPAFAKLSTLLSIAGHTHDRAQLLTGRAFAMMLDLFIWIQVEDGPDEVQKRKDPWIEGVWEGARLLANTSSGSSRIRTRDQGIMSPPL